jgi:ABC-type glycerol-3-phosphate transport system substrate-binding protein
MFPNLNLQTQNSGPNSSGQSPKKPKMIFAVAALAIGGVIALQLITAKKNSGGQSGSTVGTSGSDTVEISLWDQEESENTKVMDDWITRFTAANPNIRVIRQTYPNEDLRTKLNSFSPSMLLLT